MAGLFAFSDDFVFFVPPIFWAPCLLSLLWMTRVYTMACFHDILSHLLEKALSICWVGHFMVLKQRFCVGPTGCGRKVVTAVPGSYSYW